MAANQRRTTRSNDSESRLAKAFIPPIVARRGFRELARVRPSIGSMTSNSLLNPVGSLPPQVYWRRRALAGVLAVLVIWLAWSAFPGKSGANAAQGPSNAATSGNGAGSPGLTPVVATTTTPPPAATTTAPPAATTTAPPVAVTTTPAAPVVPKCGPNAIQLTLTTDHTVYAAGALPRFVLVVTNASAAPCRVDVGTAARNFVVTSGSDRIWSSADCTKTAANVSVFKAKESVSYSHDWGRARSNPAGCAAQGTQALPGTYKVVAHVGDVTSAIAVFRLV